MGSPPAPLKHISPIAQTCFSVRGVYQIPHDQNWTVESPIQFNPLLWQLVEIPSQIAIIFAIGTTLFLQAYNFHHFMVSQHY